MTPSSMTLDTRSGLRGLPIRKVRCNVMLKRIPPNSYDLPWRATFEHGVKNTLLSWDSFRSSLRRTNTTHVHSRQPKPPSSPNYRSDFVPPPRFLSASTVYSVSQPRVCCNSNRPWDPQPFHRPPAETSKWFPHCAIPPEEFPLSTAGPHH